MFHHQQPMCTPVEAGHRRTMDVENLQVPHFPQTVLVRLKALLDYHLFSWLVLLHITQHAKNPIFLAVVLFSHQEVGNAGGIHKVPVGKLMLIQPITSIKKAPGTGASH